MKNKVLFLDVDGCLSKGRFAAFDIEKYGKVRQLFKAQNWTVVLASGRSQPYMEAMTQALDLSAPYICENGACIFSSELGEYLYSNPSLELSEYRERIVASVEGTPQFEPGKEHSLSLRVLRQGKAVDAQNIAAWLGENCAPPSSLRVTYSSCSIDVVPAGVDKATAANFMATMWHQDLQDCFAFGDSNNDIELLRAVGYAAAPNNASPAVKELVDFVSTQNTVDGLIDFLTVMSSQ